MKANARKLRPMVVRIIVVNLTKLSTKHFFSFHESFLGLECCSSVYRIGKGSYSMVDDEAVRETEQLGFCLDFNVTFQF